MLGVAWSHVESGFLGKHYKVAAGTPSGAPQMNKVHHDSGWVLIMGHPGTMVSPGRNAALYRNGCWRKPALISGCLGYHQQNMFSYFFRGWSWCVHYCWTLFPTSWSLHSVDLYFGITLLVALLCLAENQYRLLGSREMRARAFVNDCVMASR